MVVQLTMESLMKVVTMQVHVMELAVDCLWLMVCLIQQPDSVDIVPILGDLLFEDGGILRN